MSTAPAVTEQQELPPLPFSNGSFLSFLATQALGAFNDNVFKQIVLLLSAGYVAVVDFQAVVQFLFAVPFLLFSGLAGDIADRFSKGRLMVGCKLAEIVVMAAGVIGFLVVSRGGAGGTPPLGMWLLAAVGFLMGTQSAFFGPPKYGGMPELVRNDDIGQAAGLTQMTTFLAIIFGIAFAGQLLDWFGDRLWIPGLVAVAIAMLGTLCSLGIARMPPTDPARRIRLRSFLSMFPTLRRIVRDDRLLLSVILAYSWFWFVGGVSLVAINHYGLMQLGLDNGQTSLMVSTLSLGIALGSVSVARLSRRKVRIGLIVPGVIGMVVCYLAIAFVPLAGPVAGRVPEAALAVRLTVFAILLVLGISAGFLSVPLLAFVQSRPAPEEKGQVVALTNWLNWVFIVGSAAVYGIGMALSAHRAELVMAAMGVSTAAVAITLVPGILRRIRADRPDFIWERASP